MASVKACSDIMLVTPQIPQALGSGWWVKTAVKAASMGRAGLLNVGLTRAMAVPVWVGARMERHASDVPTDSTRLFGNGMTEVKTAKPRAHKPPTACLSATPPRGFSPPQPGPPQPARTARH